MMMMNTPPQPLLWLVYGSAPVQIKSGTNRHTIAATAVVPSSVQCTIESPPAVGPWRHVPYGSTLLIITSRNNFDV